MANAERCRAVVRLGALAVVLVLVAGLPAAAQDASGNLFAEVRGPDGATVEGVAVTLSGQDYERTVPSGEGGQARFTRLQPGLYSLTAKLAGFATLVLEDVEVNSYANVALVVVLTPSEDLTESIVVTAQTPLLDQRKTGTSTVLTQKELSQVPQSRDPWSVLSTVPGITTDRVNVGGNEAGQQANFVTKGDDGRNATWIMDGVEITDVGAIGSSATYYDFNSFEEIGFVTGGGDVEGAQGGARLNFTTKQGSNSVTGDIRMWYASDGTQSDISGLDQPPNAADQALPNNLINEVFEKNFDIGGPVWKDHIWYWFGFSQNDIDINVAGTSDKTKLKSNSLKFHGQIAQAKGNWRAFYTDTNKTKTGRGAAVTRPVETTWDQKGPSPIYSGSFSYFFSPNFELSAQISKVDGGFSLTPKGGLDAQIINDAENVWNGSFVLYDTLRPQTQYSLKGSNFVETGSWEHEIKYGYRYKEATVESLSKWSNSDFFVYSGAYIFLYRERTLEVDLNYDTLWASDTVIHGPWAINFGATYTNQTGKNKPRPIADVAICPTCLPGLDYQGSDVPYGDWNDISPRLGLTYTFNTDRRILLRANYAEYVDQLNVEDIQYDNPGGQYVYVYTYWNDDNDNGQVDEGEFSTDCEDYLGGTVDACNPLEFNFLIDPNYEAPKVTEYILGGEFEIAKDFTIAANFVTRERDKDRWYQGNLDGRPTGYLGPRYDVPYYEATGNLRAIPASGYDCDTLLTGEFPDGTPYSEPICDLNAAGQALTAPASTFLTNRPGYTQTYTGIELTATKRLSNRWMLRGFFNYATWEQDFSGVAGISDPTNFQGGTTEDGGAVATPSTGSGTKDGVWPGTSRWQFNVNGLYQLPRNWTVSANLNARQGYGIPYYDRSGVKDVQIGKVDDRRYDDLYTFDIKVGKTLNFNGTVVDLGVEVFNVFNDNTVIGVNPRVDQSSTNAIRENLSPRILRAGASVRF